MGWAKYTEDIRTIMEERLETRKPSGYKNDFSGKREETWKERKEETS